MGVDSQGLGAGPYISQPVFLSAGQIAYGSSVCTLDSCYVLWVGLTPG